MEKVVFKGTSWIKESDRHDLFFFFFNKIMTEIKIKRYTKTNYTRIPNEKEISYESNDEVLVYECSDGIYYNLVCIRDMIDNNRYFIGYLLGEYCQNNVVGMFAYFDDDNNLKQKNVCNTKLFGFDTRNGYMSTKNTYLYHNSLVMFQGCRDGQNIISNMCTFDEYDNVVSSVFKYNLDLKTSYFLTTNVVLNRFIAIEYYKTSAQKNHYIFFDLQSFSFTKEKDPKTEPNDNFVCEYYTHLSIESFVDEYTKTHSPETEYENYIYADVGGYPTRCIKCSNITSNIIAYNKNLIGSMGSGFCEKCLIRYSLSDKIWICCKFGNNICYGKLNKDTGHECEKEHSLNVTYEFNTKKNLKIPYKSTGSISYKQK